MRSGPLFSCAACGRHGAAAIGALFLCLFSVISGVSQESPRPSRLPWETPSAIREPVLRPPAHAAEVLERFDIGLSQLDHFGAGADFSTAEQDVLAKILYHLPRLGLDNLHRWRKKQPDWMALVADPASHRLEVLPIKGRVTRVTRRKLLPEQAELYSFDHYFLVNMALDDLPQRAIIAARAVPNAWPLDADIDEPAAADGLFLKSGDEAAQSAQFFFAAIRVAWHPEKVEPDKNVNASQLVLARLGFDVGLWDEVRSSPKHALTAGDREAFYQLLAAIGRDKDDRLKAAASEAFNVVPLLEKPAEHHGDIGRVKGLARRITRVPVGDLDMRVRFRIDEYYEIDLFVPLPAASLRLGKDPTGEKNPVYQNSFPATLIVRRLPPGLKEGENLHADVAANSAFFKIWSFRSAYTARFGQLQPAPLFMADTASVVQVPSQANWVASALVTAALSIALGVTVLMAWWYRSGETRHRRAVAEQLDLSTFTG